VSFTIFSEYPRMLCKCKTEKIRTYCPCSLGVILCDKCFANHVIDKKRKRKKKKLIKHSPDGNPYVLKILKKDIIKDITHPIVT